MKNFISTTLREPDVFSVGEIYIKAWESVKRHWIKATLLILVNVGLYFSQFIVASVLAAASTPVVTIVGINLGIFLCQIYFSAVSIKLFIHAGRDKDFLMSRLFKIKPRTLVSYAVVNLCLAIMMFIGFLFFIIPGVYIAFIYIFSGFLVIDKNLGPFEALAASKKLFKSHLFNLFQYVSVSFCLLYLLIMPVYALLVVRMLGSVILSQFINTTIFDAVLLIPALILMCASIVVYVGLVLVFWFGMGHIYHKIASRN